MISYNYKDRESVKHQLINAVEPLFQGNQDHPKHKPEEVLHCSTLSSFLKPTWKPFSSHSISTPANINTQFQL